MCKHILFNDFELNEDVHALKSFVSLTYDKDGFGAIMRTDKGVIETLKGLQSESFYIDLITRLCLGDIRTLVVHHRTSTNGAGIDYTHPFEYKGNYLTHNGVVTMPGNYPTKTTNDSEKLLHHLIETDFETKTVEGYYSCFILNQTETMIVVDQTAPIYTNGRIYSSHKLSDDYVKIEKSLIRLDPFTGEIASHIEIEIMESDYGKDVVHLSLGQGYSYGYADDIPMNDETFSVNVTEFFDLLTEKEEMDLASCSSKFEMQHCIDKIAWLLGMQLTESEVECICECIEVKAA